MSTQTLQTPKTKTKKAPEPNEHFVAQADRSIEWLGGVNYENKREVMKSIRSLMASDKEAEIFLTIDSYGGATAIGMGFYDSVRSVLKPSLTTIGSGEVDSSGIIVFLAGRKRYLTKNTTMLLHLGGRTFESSKRFSTLEVENMLKESRLKDYQYACVLSDATSGRCTPEKILELMAADTILTAEEAVNLGFADKILA